MAVYAQREMRKPPPLLTPRIIADLRSGDECADPDHPGLLVRRTNAARPLRRDLLPKLGDRAAAGLTRRELQDEVIRPMLKRGPRGGTYLLSRIRCAYAHAAEQGRIPDDFVFPTLGIKGAPQVRRKRSALRNTRHARRRRANNAPIRSSYLGRFTTCVARWPRASPNSAGRASSRTASSITSMVR